jgi:hypothetical protein
VIAKGVARGSHHAASRLQIIRCVCDGVSLKRLDALGMSGDRSLDHRRSRPSSDGS